MAAAPRYALDELALRIEQVHQFVGVDFLRRREDDDFKELRDALEKRV